MKILSDTSSPRHVSSRMGGRSMFYKHLLFYLLYLHCSFSVQWLLLVSTFPRGNTPISFTNTGRKFDCSNTYSQKRFCFLHLAYLCVWPYMFFMFPKDDIVKLNMSPGIPLYVHSLILVVITLNLHYITGLKIKKIK